ncbi:MAG: LysR family transcriptional regulator [Sulfuricella sp.]|nr:LysR family transcriptional regulator [Sulfuricella sp.]
MDKLTQIRAFVRVAERTSFSAVARDLQVTQSAVSKAITALESHLGARLVSRSTRSVSLTEAGRRYYERCRQILADLEAADAAVGNLASGVTGTLNISAPVPFGLMFISPRVLRFKGLNPSLAVNFDLSDQPLNLVEQNIDVAIRLGHLNTPGLVARKLGDSPFIAVASPAYLAAHGTPETPSDLAVHNCVVYSNQTNPLEWAFEGSAGDQSVVVASNYQSNNLLALKDAAISGTGLACLPLWMVDTEIKAGLLRPVLENVRLPAFGIHAVFPSARQIPAKVRLFVDFLQDELSSVSYFLGMRRGVKDASVDN